MQGMKLVTTYASTAAFISASTCAVAQTAETRADDKVVTLRAVGPHVSEQIIRHVAKNAEPTVLASAQFPNAAVTTPKEIITRLCGDVTTPYVEEAARANGLATLPLDEPLGERAKTFIWPACLYVNRSAADKKVVIVKPGQTASGIYRSFTGGGGGPAAVSKFFGLSKARLDNLVAGVALPIPAQTVTVPIVAKNGTGAQLADELRLLDPTKKMINQVESDDGDIVLGLPAGGATSSGPECPGTDQAPFDVPRTLLAYQFAQVFALKEEVLVAGERAEISIVDNGFFGAKAQADGSNPFVGSPFKRRFFKPDRDDTIALSISMGRPIRPLNYANNIEPDMQSGHGTHVVGLVLGGPHFHDHIEKLTPAPWASITIVNVGAGSRTLFKGASGFLASHLNADQAGRIVNLSIAHSGSSDSDARVTYARLFDSAPPASLFVVAAGNYGRDVEDKFIYPAAHGGTGKRNVITVAAIDVNDKLASFSDHSSTAVDLGAPGCQISSWISRDQTPVAMSGTSQAAPLVTFTAALLRSVSGKAMAATLKNRIVTSGALLPESERGKTAFEVKLNIPHALLWFHDILRVRAPDGTETEYLGDIQRLSSLKCRAGNAEKTGSQQDMWALKRSDAEVSYLYYGVSSGQVKSPCRVIDDDGATLAFSATHEVEADGTVTELPQKLERNWAVKDVRDLVVRTSLDELR